MEDNMKLAEIIRNYMEKQGIGATELSRKSGIPLRTVNNIIKGLTENPGLETVRSLATALGYTLNDIDMNMNDENSENLQSKARINVYGSIPAGIPIEAIEDVVGWEDIAPDMLAGGKEYFGLKVKGDSMEPKYLEGDTIIVQRQSDCESGDDCVVYVNGYDATLKKVIKKIDCLILQPLNSKYEPKVYDYNDEYNSVKIAGVVKELRRKI